MELSVQLKFAHMNQHGKEKSCEHLMMLSSLSPVHLYLEMTFNWDHSIYPLEIVVSDSLTLHFVYVQK